MPLQAALFRRYCFAT